MKFNFGTHLRKLFKQVYIKKLDGTFVQKLTKQIGKIADYQNVNLLKRLKDHILQSGWFRIMECHP